MMWVLAHPSTRFFIPPNNKCCQVTAKFRSFSRQNLQRIWKIETFLCHCRCLLYFVFIYLIKIRTLIIPVQNLFSYVSWHCNAKFIEYVSSVNYIWQKKNQSYLAEISSARQHWVIRHKSEEREPGDGIRSWGMESPGAKPFFLPSCQSSRYQSSRKIRILATLGSLHATIRR